MNVLNKTSLVKPISSPVIILSISLLVSPSLSFALADENKAEGPCSFVITGEVEGDVEVNCPGVPKAAIDKLIASLEEQRASMKEQRITARNQNKYIAQLEKDIEQLKLNRKKALAENAEDLKNNPEDPLLAAEREALESFDMEFAAQLREKYYRKLYKEKRAEQKARKQAFERQQAIEDQALAREAYIAGERWESANKLSKALPLYKEAVDIYPKYLQVWRQITLTAGKLGNLSLALKASQSLQQQADVKTESRWLMVALNDEGDIFKRLGENGLALSSYRRAMQISKKAVVAEPENTEWQRDLSVSHNKVGDMHKANGDGVSALKAYEESLAIRKILAELNPQVVEWQTDLVVSYYKLSEVQPEKAGVLLADALAILKRLHKENRLDHQKQGWIPILENALNQ